MLRLVQWEPLQPGEGLRRSAGGRSPLGRGAERDCHVFWDECFELH